MITKFYEFISMVAVCYAIAGAWFLKFNATELPMTFFALGWTLGYVLTTSIRRLYRE